MKDPNKSKKTLKKTSTDLEKKALAIPKTKTRKQPIIADESDYEPITLASPKKRTPFFIIIGIIATVMIVILTIVSVQQSTLKKEYQEVTEWNDSVGTYFEAFQLEKDFYKYMNASWLRIVEEDDLKTNVEYTEANRILDVAKAIERERSIVGLVSLLKEKTPTYQYFDSPKNKQNVKVINAKKKALIIYDQQEIFFTDDFMYGRYHEGGKNEWCHVLERVDGKFRVSKYQPKNILKNRTIENFNNTAVFLNNRRLSDEELISMINRAKGIEEELELTK